MTTHEKEAVLGYLEFALTTMVEGLEQDKILKGQAQVGAVYDAAYEVLNDFERLLSEQEEMVKIERSKISK